MKSILIAAILLLTINVGYTQTTVEQLVRRGIGYHDNQEYDKAIETYKEALKIDPKSALVNYELAFSYLKKGDYQQAVNYSDKVLKQKGEYMIPSYVAKGSALDLLGKTKESIKLLEKAIKKTEGHYLLHYNLALNYFKHKNYKKAEAAAIAAIAQKATHSSSHLMLATIHHEQGNKVQAVLAAHFFLLLEPNSARSVQAYQLLKANFEGRVSKDKTEGNTVNITISPDKDSEFSSAELMLGLLEATKTLEENADKSEEELFVENTTSFFTMLGELNEGKSKSIWWTLYTPIFYKLAKSEQMEAYCNYISQVGNENAQQWLSENEEKLKKFDGWLRTNF